MTRQVIQDTVIPAEHGMAFEVKKGQVLRIYLVEDKQVGRHMFLQRQRLQGVVPRRPDVDSQQFSRNGHRQKF